jgi:hypothetical protein
VSELAAAAAATTAATALLLTTTRSSKRGVGTSQSQIATVETQSSIVKGRDVVRGSGWRNARVAGEEEVIGSWGLILPHWL